MVNPILAEPFFQEFLVELSEFKPNIQQNAPSLARHILAPGLTQANSVPDPEGTPLDLPEWQDHQRLKDSVGPARRAATTPIDTSGFLTPLSQPCRPRLGWVIPPDVALAGKLQGFRTGFLLFLTPPPLMANQAWRASFAWHQHAGTKAAKIDA